MNIADYTRLSNEFIRMYDNLGKRYDNSQLMKRKEEEYRRELEALRAAREFAEEKRARFKRLWDSMGTNNEDYTTLGIQRDATCSEIKKAYRKLAIKYHPDHGGTKENFCKINEAYNRLVKS